MSQHVSYNQYSIRKAQLLQTMASELPNEFDLIVIGTGLEESIIAAAGARNGHSVLHLDPEEYYGSDWASFNFDGFQDFIKQKQSNEKESEEIDYKQFCTDEKDEFIPLKYNSNNAISDIKETWFAPSIKDFQVDEEKQKQNDEITPKDDNDDTIKEVTKSEIKVPIWTKESIKESSRRFNLDLIPKLLYTRGDMVELLISSNISRYTEFKAVSRVLTKGLNGKLEHVPSSRADVFATKQVSVVEKRLLMKFLNSTVSYNPENYANFADKPFVDFLKHEKLTENLIHFIMNSIAMADKDTKTLEGIQSCHKFLTSLGRFGSNTTPFLWTMYGSGEMPQAFCRLSAVFGGTYYLGRQVNGFIVNDGTLKGIVINRETRINCKNLVINGLYLPNKLKSDKIERSFRRKISINEDSVLASNKEQLSLITLSNPNHGFTFMYEVGHSAAATPKSLYVLHTTKSEDFEQDEILNDVKKLWSVEFKVNSENCTSVVGNLFPCCGPIFELDYDSTVSNAKKIFQLIFKDEDFLPRAPDPEEIIIGGGDEEDASIQGEVEKSNSEDKDNKSDN